MDYSAFLNKFLETALNVVVIPILPTITAYISAFIRKKTKELEYNMKNTQLTAYMNLAQTVVVTAVSAVNQVYADDLKKKNGVLSAGEQETAFQMARDKVYMVLGDEVILAVKELYKDFEEWLDAQIEYSVNILKTVPTNIEV